MKLELSTFMFSIVFSVGAILVLFFYAFPYFESSVPEILGVFLGLPMGFSLNRYIEALRMERDRKDLLCSLRVELETTKGTSTTEEIYPDIWDSTISSGKLSNLLLSKQLVESTGLYRRIRELNNERRRVRECQEDFETSPIDLPEQRGKLYERWKGWESTHITHTDNLNKEIEKVLQNKELWEES